MHGFARDLFALEVALAMRAWLDAACCAGRVAWLIEDRTVLRAYAFGSAYALLALNCRTVQP